MKRITRWIPLIIIIFALALFFYFRLYKYFTFTELQKNHEFLKQWTAQHYFMAVLIYMVIYIIAVTLSVPGATILTITGGFLFGYIFGTIYVVISATIGACCIFLAVQTALGEWLEKKAARWIRRMEEGFQKNAMSYLLFLRLVPIFPFWAINIVPALLGVRFRTFAFATLIGIIPGSLVYVLVGNGLGSLLELGKKPNLDIIFEPQILIPLLFLGAFSLIPIIYKKLTRDKKNA